MMRRFVEVPADWWSKWKGKWSIDSLEFYLLSSVSNDHRSSGGVELEPGQVLIAVRGLEKSASVARSTIQGWIARLAAGEGSLVEIRLANRDSKGSVYWVYPLHEGPSRRPSRRPDRPPAMADKALEERGLEGAQGGRVGGLTGGRAGLEGPNRRPNRRPSRRPDQPPAEADKAQGERGLEAGQGGRCGGRTGGRDGHIDRQIERLMDARAREELQKAMRLDHLPDEVLGALSRWATAGGGREHLAALIQRCALETRRRPVAYLATAIDNELREKPPRSAKRQDPQADAVMHPDDMAALLGGLPN